MANVGFRYPFRFEDGAPSPAEGDALVASSLMKIISTVLGEIVYDNDNGHDLYRYIFENIDALISANVRRDLTLAIVRIEPRAQVISVPVSVSRSGESRVLDALVVWSYNGRVFSTRRRMEVEG